MAQPPSHPVIVVPGITASFLADQYALKPENVWAILTKEYERVTLHPDDLRYEAREPARVGAGQLNKIAYNELVSELRYNLSARADQPTPVFPFPYDWRMPLDQVAAQLDTFVDEVIDRTKLIKHYHDAGWSAAPRVNLVAHSMGGLVVAGFLERFGSKQRVAKVATLAAPFQGSFEAVLKIATGTGDLGSDAPSSRERESARLLPALYHLLPTIRGGVKSEDGLGTNLFHAPTWQPSVVATLAEFIRLHGLERSGRKQQAATLFAGILRQAKAFRKRANGLRLSNAGLQPADWLCVAGVDAKTRVRLQIVQDGGKPDFRFRSADRLNAWEKADPDGMRDAGQDLTGDGTVPLNGAVPKFLDRKNLVCVAPEDFGYWQPVDRLLSRAAGFHGILPKMDMLHRLIVRHFTGRADRRGSTWGRPAPGVTPSAWSPAVASLRNKDRKM